MSTDSKALTKRLRVAGCVAAAEEAAELLECAHGDGQLLESLISRRLRGEPLAWITGSVPFCELNVRVTPGVYVPRWQSEPLVRRAVERLSTNGIALDLCTGTGAIAATLSANRPAARVIASDLDERAVACAQENGVEAYCGDLFAPFPPGIEGRIDVIVAVPPYVPTPELSLLPRDTLEFESPLAYDGGDDGTRLLRRIIINSQRYLRIGGALLVELGGAQAETLAPVLVGSGFSEIIQLADEDGDLRGIEATLMRSG